MKKGFKWKLIAGCSALASLFILGGCKVGALSFGELKENLNWDARVTYYANSVGKDDPFKADGQFENTQGVKDMYYAAGSYAARIGEKKIANVSLTHYAHSFEGWYHVAKDDQGRLLFVDKDGEKLYQGEDSKLYYADKDGNPVLDDDTVITVPVRSEEKVDFTKTLADGDHWSICADWDEMSRLHIKLVCDDLGENEKIAGLSMDSKQVEYEHGDIVWEDFFEGEEDKVQSLGMAPFTVNENAFTFVEYYTDEECTQFVSWPIAWNENDQVIYAKYIKGDWNIIKKAEDVSDIFTRTIGEDDKFYLIQDIDCAGVTTAENINTFRGELQGNGFKIKNLTVAQSKDKNPSYALFGDIKETAKIENVIFENVTVKFATDILGNAQNMYFLFFAMEMGATVSNVDLTGKLEITLNKRVSNNNIVYPANKEDNDIWWKHAQTQADINGFDMSGVVLDLIQK